MDSFTLFETAQDLHSIKDEIEEGVSHYRLMEIAEELGEIADWLFDESIIIAD